MEPSTHATKMSIVVPCYNTEKYLPSCLDSLMAQTLDDIEVICVNNGSTDGCLDIMRDYERRHPSKMVVIDRENGGPWNARWDGIRRARGEYIGFLDSDDNATKDFAERLYGTAKASEADICVCGFNRVDLDSGTTLSSEMCSPREPFCISQDPGRIVELNGATWNKAFRAEVLQASPTLSFTPATMEDLFLNLLAYLTASTSCASGGRIVFVPRTLINYQVRPGSRVNTITTEKVESAREALREIRGIYLRSGASWQMLEAVDAVAFLHLAVSMVFRLSYDKEVDLGETIDETTKYLDQEFPTWRNSPYISPGYAQNHGASYRRLLVAHRAWKAHAMPALLAAYRFTISRIGKDIKW